MFTFDIKDMWSIIRIYDYLWICHLKMRTGVQKKPAKTQKKIFLTALF